MVSIACIKVSIIDSDACMWRWVLHVAANKIAQIYKTLLHIHFLLNTTAKDAKSNLGQDEMMSFSVPCQLGCGMFYNNTMPPTL